MALPPPRRRGLSLPRLGCPLRKSPRRWHRDLLCRAHRRRHQRHGETRGSPTRRPPLVPSATSVLGVSVALSEAEVHWRDFLQCLQDRGLHGLTFLVSDDHASLRAALRARFPGVPWQRCQFHLQQNALHHCPKVALRHGLAADLRAVFNAASRPEADAKLRALAGQHQASAPALAAWLEASVPESLSVFLLPPEHRLRMRTSNLLENLNKQIRRRTRVASLFPNTDSLLRLVSAITAEISDDWLAAKAYLNMNQTSHLLSA